jgi:hypothetical protein
MAGVAEAGESYRALAALTKPRSAEPIDWTQGPECPSWRPRLKSKPEFQPVVPWFWSAGASSRLGMTPGCLAEGEWLEQKGLYPRE